MNGFPRWDKPQKKTIGLDKTVQGHYAKKFICPDCRQKTFVRYFDFDQMEYLPERYGRCDREEHCQYFEAPWEDLKKESMGKRSEWNPNSLVATPTQSKPIMSVEKEVVSKTMQYYNQNTFIQFLISKFGEQKTMEAVYKYYLGTGKGNGTVYWFIDRFMRIRTAKKMHYHSDGHRDKSFGAEYIYTLKDGFTSCLFGEHLLFTIAGNPVVAIVESEKSAVICGINIICMDGRPVIWMASSAMHGMTEDKIRPLAGMDVVLVPDFSYVARATWGVLPMRKRRNPEKGRLEAHPDGELDPEYESYAKKLQKIGCNVSFYDPHPEINDGSDLADLLLIINDSGGRNDPETDPEPDGIERLPVPVFDVPDFSSFTLPGHVEVERCEISQNKAGLSESDPLPLTGRKTFAIGTGSVVNGRLTVEMMEVEHEHRVEKFINQDNIKYLIEKLDICRGSIEPIKPF